ncbi:uncharacterized protein BJ212DRAFT_1070566 [Suillus subaureus]|uniref:F-box domain-containing protein n=1 Tax=Suillus subaureus TaxID=48587 RepID=A0A9P7EG05_9AGAM|nr:uncharacterized protein BJ212DRAFT_1070566 [Suillus subaureus]KAG1819847.1 hypothetical protein BJ212DRAFT_1070566 [Suillus subaureus]
MKPLLSVIPIEKCIFPRLRSLTWALSTVKYFDLFLPHTLRQCYIMSVSELQSAVTHCAALELLSIQTSDMSAADEPSLLSDGVRLCEHLVTLSCPPLDWVAWKHLSSLPTLLSVNRRSAQCSSLAVRTVYHQFLTIHYRLRPRPSNFFVRCPITNINLVRPWKKFPLL